LKEKNMRRKWTWIVRAVLLGVLVCVLLCLGMGAVKTPNREMPPGLRRLMDAAAGKESLPEQRGLEIDYTCQDWSLDEREQLDFLLTPALLVQEAVSDGIILTYPEE
jgi:hypothetical protein